MLSQEKKKSNFLTVAAYNNNNNMMMVDIDVMFYCQKETRKIFHSYKIIIETYSSSQPAVSKRKEIDMLKRNF